jgi:murein DD-endopeptidase MepM/ murein hydrolase activator NlpD
MFPISSFRGREMKKRLVILTSLAAVLLIGSFTISHRPQGMAESSSPEHSKESPQEIKDVVKPGETMSGIFHRHGLSDKELFPIRKASAGIHRLRKIVAGQPYEIRLDNDNNVLSFTYQIDEEALLHITRDDPGFRAEKIDIPYEKKIGKFGGVIDSNLYDSLGNGEHPPQLAYLLSDIFSWDFDFTTDLRKGDTFKVIVEELWLDGRFKRLGPILAAEFVNDGKTYRAFRYEGPDGRAGYYDEEGKSLQRSFLKAPLSYRRISSTFSYSRRHPILKIRRPHLGVDYVAPRGTPVSALGDGTVKFARYKGANGNLVILRHPKGFTTYYGHLHKIRKGIRRGVRVSQGDVIGYVGSTGRASGPHLHFQMKKGSRIINPLRVNVPRRGGIPKQALADFHESRYALGLQLGSIVTALREPGPEPAEQNVASTR